MTVETKLTTAELNAMVQHARIMEADSHGAKVYLLLSGNYLKLFRRKRWFSSALLTPYSRRFIKNARALQSRNIPTISPLSHITLAGPGLTGVLYEPLQGDTLRSIAAGGDFEWQPLIDALVQLIRDLHEGGIYFRSLHLGNIVRSPDGRLGLIDIADMKVFRHPLSRRHRERNLAHFQRYLEHEKIAGFPFEKLKAKILHC